MPRETIDLLSSSPEPASQSKIKRPKPSPSNTTTRQPAMNGNKTSTHEIFEISSGEEEPSPARRLSSLEARDSQSKPKVSVKGTSAPIISGLSSDDLPELQGLPELIPRKAEDAHNMSNFNNTNGHKKRDRDFFYLSEDFDTTLDVDFSSAQLQLTVPVAKKTRISPEVSRRTKSTSGKFDMKEAAAKRSYSALGGPATTSTNPKSKQKPEDLDPIVFTSSPDPYAKASRKFTRTPPSNDAHSRGGSSKLVIPPLSSDAELSEIEKPAKSKSRSKSTQTVYELYEANREKEKQKAAKKADKDEKAFAREAEKEKKRTAREDKKKEKEKAAELAKVNTLRTDKKVSAPEMIVDLPSTLDSKLKAQTEALLTGFSIEHTTYETQKSVIKFRRKIDATYNENLDQYEPVPRHIKGENHIIYVMMAHEFVKLVADEDFDVHFLRLKTKYDCQIILLIQGYNIFIRKNRNIKNRQFTQAVRAAGPTLDDARTANLRRKKEAEYVDEDLLEAAILKLQMIHEFLIHHTAVIHETAEQIAVFTQHISTIPYKSNKQRAGEGFCMESGQVKTGDGPEDTYIKMLQEINRITAPIAYGIASKYPTVRELIEGLQSNGPETLADCLKSANKDGAFTDKRVGPAVSKRIYKVFTGRDVGSTDI